MKIAHWTPRYLVNRARWFIYERRNPDKPWLTPRANALLAEMLRPTDVGLEWGSGRSTLWFARRLKHLTSVEHNPGWYERVKSQLAAAGVANVDYVLAPDPSSSAYMGAADRFADESLGFALVDGESRGKCALAAIPKIAPGGVLVTDNINWFLDHPTHSPQSRVGQGPADDDWAQFEKTVAGWRCLWTTSGITDTALWIKPGLPATNYGSTR